MMAQALILLAFVAVLALCGIGFDEPEREHETWEREKRQEQRQALWRAVRQWFR